MPHRDVRVRPPLHRWQLAGLALLSAAAWFGGGATVDVGSTDELLVLLSLPVLALGVLGWLHMPSPAPVARAALAAASLLALVPTLQLLLPGAGGGTGRAAIAADLAQAGAVGGLARWTLTPQATEHALWSLLPPLACFLCASLLDHHWRRRCVQLALGLVLANLAFGFFQAGLPEGHAMRLYTDNGTGFGGVLINGNHQASALVIGMLLALGLAAEARRRSREQDDSSRQMWAYLGAAAACFLCIPLAGSTAGMLIGVLLLAAGIPAIGLLGSVRKSRGMGRIALAGIAVVGLVGIAIGTQWMDLAQTDPLRHAAAKETWALGNRFLPLGSGVGSFVQTFEQAAGALFQRGEYINHAHNEYAQWWLEGGLLALLAGLAVFAVLGWVGLRLLRDRHQRPLGVACWLGLCALLAHSLIDYPLRTLSLMTLAGLLAGLALADARREREIRKAIHRDDAAQPA